MVTHKQDQQLERNVSAEPSPGPDITVYPCRRFCNQNNDESEDEISLFDLVEVIYRQKKIITMGVATALLIAIIWLFLTPNTYTAEATIMPLQGRNTIALPSNLMGIQGLKEMIGESMPGMLEAPNSQKIRSVLTGRRLNLMLVERYDLLPVLFADDWDKTKQRWFGDERRTGLMAWMLRVSEPVLGQPLNWLVKGPSALDGSAILQRKVSVITVKGDGALKIEFSDKDPQFAAIMVSRYLEALDETLRSEAITRASDSRSYVETLKQTQASDQAKKRLDELSLAFAEQEMYAKMKPTFLFEVLDPSLVPERPSRPKRLLIVVLAALASFFACVLMVFMLEAIKNARAERRRAAMLQG